MTTPSSWHVAEWPSTATTVRVWRWRRYYVFADGSSMWEWGPVVGMDYWAGSQQ